MTPILTGMTVCREAGRHADADQYDADADELCNEARRVLADGGKR